MRRASSNFNCTVSAERKTSRLLGVGDTNRACGRSGRVVSGLSIAPPKQFVGIPLLSEGASDSVVAITVSVWGAGPQQSAHESGKSSALRKELWCPRKRRGRGEDGEQK